MHASPKVYQTQKCSDPKNSAANPPRRTGTGVALVDGVGVVAAVDDVRVLASVHHTPSLLTLSSQLSTLTHCSVKPSARKRAKKSWGTEGITHGVLGDPDE